MHAHAVRITLGYNGGRLMYFGRPTVMICNQVVERQAIKSSQ